MVYWYNPTSFVNVFGSYQPHFTVIGSLEPLDVLVGLGTTCTRIFERPLKAARKAPGLVEVDLSLGVLHRGQYCIPSLYLSLSTNQVYMAAAFAPVPGLKFPFRSTLYPDLVFGLAAYSYLGDEQLKPMNSTMGIRQM